MVGDAAQHRYGLPGCNSTQRKPHSDDHVSDGLRREEVASDVDSSLKQEMSFRV
jgi:hypothetical protein